MGTFSECRGDCGVGVQNRTVQCSDSLGNQASESSCDVNIKPSETQSCVLDPCEEDSTVSSSMKHKPVLLLVLIALTTLLQ